MHALWAFDEAVEVALDFRKRNPDTLVIVASDHETGGLSITYAQRELSPVWSHTLFNPGEAQLGMIGGITLSSDGLIRRLGKEPSPEALDRLLAEHYPGFHLDPDLREMFLKNQPLDRNFTYGRANVLGRMVARQTGYYWGTSGHTPEPVAVGAIGPGAELFRGYQDNTSFARNLRALIEGR
jgi:alkaline phosphatase